jgi:hypothetical protein
VGIPRLVPAQAEDPHALDGLRMQVRAFIAEQRSAGAIGTGVAAPDVDSRSRGAGPA